MAVTWPTQIQKAVKKAARREQLQREEAEQKRLKALLELQFILDKLGDESVRQELKQVSLLVDEDLTAIDEFYKLVGPERNQNVRWASCLQGTSGWTLLRVGCPHISGKYFCSRLNLKIKM